MIASVFVKASAGVEERAGLQPDHTAALERLISWLRMRSLSL